MKTPTRRVLLNWILAGLGAVGLSYGALFFSERAEPAPGYVPIHLPTLVEASGLAASHRSSDLLWSQNDSGGQPVLYGFDTKGEPRGALRVLGVKNIDWEAISSFESEGRSWIAIGDVGDNLGRHATSILYVVEEPAEDQLSPSRETPVPVAWRVLFRFETGPHDCEAIMVDPRLQEILLITKRTSVPEIYRLPLRPTGSGTLTAKKIGTLAHVPHPNFKQKLFPLPAGRFRGQVTDASLSPDGTRAAILTYGDVLIYERAPGQSWPTAFGQEPKRLWPHGLPQAEGICFSRGGTELFVTGEQRHPLLLRYTVPAPEKR